MCEPRIYEPQSDYLDYVYQDGKIYISPRATAKLLDMSLNSFQVALSYCRLNKKLKNKDWFLLFMEKRITVKNVYYYDRELIEAYKRFLWECDDFIYKMLNALDEIVNSGLLTIEELCEICEINHKGTMRDYLTCYKVFGFEQALKIYTKLRIYEWNSAKTAKTSKQ